MIIDCNIHFAEEGIWPTGIKASYEDFKTKIPSDVNYISFMTGLPGILSNEKVITDCEVSETLMPVLSLSLQEDNSIQELEKFSDIRRVKFHPRLGNFSYEDESFHNVLKYLNDQPEKWTVWLCSYCYGVEKMNIGSVETIYNICLSYPNINFIVAHSTGPSFMQLAHAIRSLKNCYLDFSYSLAQYVDTYFMQDLSYLFNSFERRILYGSDYPEVDPKHALDSMIKILKLSKAEAFDRVLYKNAQELFEINE